MINTAAASGLSIPKAAAMPVAARTRSPIDKPTQPAIRAAARGQRPRTRKTSSEWPNFVPGRESRARHAIAAATAAAQQQHRDRPARQHAAHRREREHHGEPHGPNGAQRAGDPADRPEPPLVVEHAREESEAHGRPDPGGRERVHDRAGAVARGGVGARDRAAAAGQRGLPAAGRGDERAGERRRREPEPAGRGVREPVDAVGDEVAEQSRTSAPMRSGLRPIPGTRQGAASPVRGRGASLYNVAGIPLGSQSLSASVQHLYPEFHARSDRRRKPAHRRGRRARARGGRKRRRRVHRGSLRGGGRGGPAHRSHWRRLLPRLGRRRGDRARLLLRGAVSPDRRDRGHHRRLRRLDAELPRRRGLGRRARARRRARGGASPLRERAVAAARRAGDRAGRAGIRADGRAALPPPDPRGGPAARRGRAPDLRRAGPDRDRPTSSRRSSASATSARSQSAS